MRPCDPEVWFLSAYEFVTYWEPAFLSYPMCLEDSFNPDFHATLTQNGLYKVAAFNFTGEVEELIPGVDYMVQDGVPGVAISSVGSLSNSLNQSNFKQKSPQGSERLSPVSSPSHHVALPVATPVCIHKIHSDLPTS